MDVISDHSQGDDSQKPEPRFDHRIRWGNVALALAALVAIVAAIGLPRGTTSDSSEESLAPVTELVTEPVPTPPTTVAAEPRRKRVAKRREKRRPRKQKLAEPAQANRSHPVTPTPRPVQAPEPAPPQPPAAEREFGL
jgi:hypothetical protein